MPSKKEFEQSVVIHTSPDNIWRVWMAVEEWPDWTDTILSIKKLSPGALTINSQVVIAQPKLTKAVWKITEFEPEKHFTWSKNNLFLKIDAVHALKATPEGCFVSLSIRFSGFFAVFINQKTRNLIDSYLKTESQSLKKFCENKFPVIVAS